MHRRQLLKLGLACPLAFASRAFAKTPIYIGDMHFHSFFGQSTYHSRPLAKTLADGRATLIAWAISGDAPWLQPTPRGFSQTAVPKPRETLTWFERELGRIKAHLADQKLKIVRTRNDVDLALQGDPHVVLAVEGASFIEDDTSRVQAAYDLGIRHLQLVHYTRNTLGDFQTERPEHNGLTDLGKKVVQECNRLGILIDLAHCSPDAVKGALGLSKVPMVWSHSSITAGAKPHWSMVAWKARQLLVDEAKAIARKGGVVGLWALRQDVGPTIESYADRLTQMAGWLGEDHVAFGTDLNGLGTNAIIHTYADLRRVVDYWERQRVNEARIRKIAIENYARVLRLALQPGST